jgi:exodeoxyribonuclease V alpha subunit
MLELDPDQTLAVSSALSHSLSVITGGPGCGKTHCIKEICNLLDINHKRYTLCAPTGKAAKRMEELTGKTAKTIHRLLGATYGSWRFNRTRPLKGYDMIIVDECSMMDIDLCYRLLQALPTTTAVCLVGDVDQLPPVGPGSPFRDIISSQKIPVSRLTINHRQGRGSTIAANAKIINFGGKSIDIEDDFQFIDCPTHIHLRERIPSTLNSLINEGYDFIRDLQVLSPQKSTQVGVEALNELLRFHFNKNAKRWDKFSVGDKVMQNVNDYQLDVFNGYIGQIVEERSDFWEIDFFDGERVRYPKEKSESLIPAYCCTIHKYQGSEAKAGVVIISSSHTYMLTRNLLYTAITRFKEKCVIMGDTIGLKRAISNTREQERYSKLLERIVN